MKSRKSNKMNVICRDNNILLVLLLLLADNNLAQTPKDDLSRGSYLILAHGKLEVEAMGWPFRYDDTSNTTFQVSWDLDTFINDSNYTSHIVGIWPLEWWPVGAGDIPWSMVREEDVNEVPYPLSPWEVRDFHNVVRVQWEDDNLNPADTPLVERAITWFDEHHADPLFENKILSINLPPWHTSSFQYTPEQLDYMLGALDPDLIMWNNYPQSWNDTYHIRQTEYGWYASLIQFRNAAQLGNDRTGTKPVPHGAYIQAFRNGYADPMPHARMYYNNFNSLLFGAKYLSTFLYTSYPYWRLLERPIEARDPLLDPDETGMVSTLFDVKAPFAPTAEFYVQAEINRQISNVGDAFIRLQEKGQRFIRATNIESFVQSIGFAAGVYDWDYGTRPDTRLTDITVTRTGFAETQDVWIGWFNPLHKSLDGTGTTDEDYFMVVNGCWDTNGTSTEQTIRLDFDFGTDDTINSLLKISRDTGLIEEVPLTLITGNTYYLDLVLDGGEGDLFKYNNGISFLLLE